MACGMGITWVRQFKHASDGAPIIRQVFYARYIDWAITTPLLLLGEPICPFTCWELC
jgi:bacteriorhodopsin